MAFKWRKWNRAVHRDFGYLFFGMTIIYALSGIAINHINDWNPNYKVYTEDIKVAPYPGKPIKQTLKKCWNPSKKPPLIKTIIFPMKVT